MKGQTAVDEVKYLWEKWQIRALVLISLLVQALLTFLAPRRKYSSNGCHKLFMWILYLSADVVAVYIIGLISSNGGHSPQKELLAFWAPFILLHLGGPDTITALAMEDNELWRRHALQLATQVLVTVYVFVRSLQHNRLWIPTVLMFVDGFIKYFERTCALFYASRDNFSESLKITPEPGPNYARLMEEYFFSKCAHIPTDFEGKNGPLEKVDQKSQGREEPDEEDQSTMGGIPSNMGGPYTSEAKKTDEMVLVAYRFYKMFKPLLADGFLSLKDRDVSRNFFVQKPVTEAIRIIEIELNLIYDVFYTKLFLLQRRRAFARVLCFVLVIASLLLFTFRWDLKNHKSDAIITFTLLFGAIALDVCAAVMFVLSDWWIIIIYEGNIKSCYKSLMLMVLEWSRWARRPHSRRWSRTISKYNLLKSCFRKPPSFFNFKYIVVIKHIRDYLLGCCYVDGNKAGEQLINFVMNEIQKKAELASEIEVAKEVYSARGNLVLQDDYFLASECLSPWTVDVDYDESLLIWHLATDICYWTTYSSDESEVPPERELCKALSDYMLYLIMWQKTLLSSVVGMSDTRFEDTSAEAKKFMNNDSISISWLADACWKAKKCMSAKFRCRTTSGESDESPEREESKFFKKFSEQVLGVKAAIEPIVAKGDKSKSVLFDACRLAKQLEMFGTEQWRITSKVWVELLCYAAVHSPPRFHIAQLSKGGELLTFVWLLMAHLGLGERFLQNQGFGWTKLVIKK